MDRIILSAGSTLDLNGLHAYYHALCNEGGMIELNGGTLEQVGTSCDFDCNGDVDLDDYVIFLGCLMGPGGGVDSGCEAPDLDADNDVDLKDFAVFGRAFAG